MSNTVRTILVLAANPISQQRLRLDLEVREIDEGLRRQNIYCWIEAQNSCLQLG